MRLSIRARKFINWSGADKNACCVNWIITKFGQLLAFMYEYSLMIDWINFPFGCAMVERTSWLNGQRLWSGAKFHFHKLSHKNISGRKKNGAERRSLNVSEIAASCFPHAHISQIALSCPVLLVQTTLNFKHTLCLSITVEASHKQVHSKPKSDNIKQLFYMWKHFYFFSLFALSKSFSGVKRALQKVPTMLQKKEKPFVVSGARGDICKQGSERRQRLISHYWNVRHSTEKNRILKRRRWILSYLEWK